jgi:hypothetical protein
MPARGVPVKLGNAVSAPLGEIRLFIRVESFSFA